jgi:Protein of unknown function (DUF3175)
MSIDQTIEEMPGNPLGFGHIRQRARGARVPRVAATNASRNGSGRSPFFARNDIDLTLELTMASAQKATRSRKAAPRKTNRKTAAKKTMARKAGSARKTPVKKSAATPKRWSQRVTKESDALDLKRGVFTLTDPKKIAASLKRSAEHSSRRKAGAYRSALSMLTFYINRAGKTLPKTQADRLQRAKTELKRQFGRE